MRSSGQFSPTWVNISISKPNKDILVLLVLIAWLKYEINILKHFSENTLNEFLDDEIKPPKVSRIVSLSEWGHPTSSLLKSAKRTSNIFWIYGVIIVSVQYSRKLCNES